MEYAAARQRRRETWFASERLGLFLRFLNSRASPYGQLSSKFDSPFRPISLPTPSAPIQQLGPLHPAPSTAYPGIIIYSSPAHGASVPVDWRSIRPDSHVASFCAGCTLRINALHSNICQLINPLHGKMTCPEHIIQFLGLFHGERTSSNLKIMGSSLRLREHLRQF